MSGAAGFLKKTATSTQAMNQFSNVDVTAIANSVEQDTQQVGSTDVQTDAASPNLVVVTPSTVVEEKEVVQETVKEVVTVEQPRSVEIKETVNKTEDYFSNGLVASSEKASAMSDFRVTNLLTSLGIKAEGNKDIRIIKMVESNNVTPLPGVDVRDTSGRISQVLTDLQEFCDITIVPAEITNIPSWVAPKEHGTFAFGGKNYFYPFNTKNSKERIDSFIDSVMKELKDGKIIKRSMFQSFEYEKSEYRTLMFTQSEMSDIVTLLSNFGANIFVIGEDDILLVAGDYIYG